MKPAQPAGLDEMAGAHRIDAARVDPRAALYGVPDDEGSR